MKKVLTLLLILFFPALIYLYFATGIPKVAKAPIYGPRDTVHIADKKSGDIIIDTVYYSIPAFSCTTTGGLIFDSKAKLDGRSYVAVFVPKDSIKTMFTLLEEDIRTKKNTYGYARFVFFMVGDSAGNVPVDAPDLAKDLHLGTDTAFNVFMTQEQFDSVKASYYVSDPKRAKDPWKTSTDAILIDRLGRIRGYYDLHTYPRIKEMKEDVNHILLRDEGAQTIEESTVEQKR